MYFDILVGRLQNLRAGGYTQPRQEPAGTRRIKRREKLLLTVKGIGSFMNARNQLFIPAQPPKLLLLIHYDEKAQI